MNPRIVFVANRAQFFVTHRLPVAIGAREAGFDVHIAVPEAPEVDALRSMGFVVHPFPLARSGAAPWTEVPTLLALTRLYRTLRPRIVHHVSLKAVLYGTLAARLTGVPAVVNALTGLGYVYSSDDLKARILRSMIAALGRTALSHPRARFIFQHPEDRDAFVRVGLVEEATTVVIRGSGVDPSVYCTTDEERGVPLVILPARMLWPKGVREFVEAARQLQAQGIPVRMALVGSTDPASLEAVPEEQLKRWVREGVVEWWGHRGDMPAVLASSNVVALPSTYGEGVPKVLIEAAACGRAIVTTDMPGCREIVQHNRNGLLVPPRDSGALAGALTRLVADQDLRAAFGRAGRALVEKEFAVTQVVEQTLGIYSEVLGDSGGSR